jgi:hypothetical protein
MFAVSDIEEYCEQLTLDGRDWAIPMVRAYSEIVTELDPNDNGIQVHFSW